MNAKHWLVLPYHQDGSTQTVYCEHELNCRNMKPHSRTGMDQVCQLTGRVRGPARRPHFSLAIISVTVQLWTHVFWVILVYFNIRNTLPKSGTFLLGHSVYTYPRHKTEVSGSNSRPESLPPWSNPFTHWKGGWLGPLGPRASRRFWRTGSNFPLPRLNRRLTGDAASRYSDYAILAS